MHLAAAFDVSVPHVEVAARYLVQHEGSARQSDIARLDNMNRVKAFRTLQRLESRGLVEIAAHGKIRQISLKPHVLHMLQEN